MLTKKQENDLETAQKKCLRCIFGYNKTYDELLEEYGLEPLKTRRTRAFLKFVRKAFDKSGVFALVQEKPESNIG